MPSLKWIFLFSYKGFKYYLFRLLWSVGKCRLLFLSFQNYWWLTRSYIMTCEQCRQNYVPIWKMNDMNTYNLESLEWSHLFIGVGPNGTGKSVHFLSELFLLIFFSMLETLLICVFFTEGCPGWSVCSHWQISSISISCQPQHSEQPGHSRSWLRLLSSSWHSPQTSELAGIWGLTVSVSGICKQKGWKVQK